MGQIQQPGKAPVNFIKLETRDVACRCCGKGRDYICENCHKLLDNGKAILIEVENNSTELKKIPTGYVIAFQANAAYVKENPAVLMTAGIYFIRETDLKEFLGNGYSKYRNTKFLNRPPKWNNSNQRPANSSRHAAQLVTGGS